MNATFNSNYIYGKQTTFIAPIKEAGMLKHVYNAPIYQMDGARRF